MFGGRFVCVRYIWERSVRGGGGREANNNKGITILL